MTTIKIFLATLFSGMLTSCVPTPFFQVYKAALSKNLDIKNNRIVYEDKNCQVSYNLWQEGGNIGF